MFCETPFPTGAQFIIAFAVKLCKGVGYDIGYCKEEWKLPGATGIDSADGSGYSADKLPDQQVDYVFSSHCLEHVNNWMYTLEYWITKIRAGEFCFPIYRIIHRLTGPL